MFILCVITMLGEKQRRMKNYFVEMTVYARRVQKLVKVNFGKMKVINLFAIIMFGELRTAQN